MSEEDVSMISAVVFRKPLVLPRTSQWSLIKFKIVRYNETQQVSSSSCVIVISR